jgi:hypothetical protein
VVGMEVNKVIDKLIDIALNNYFDSDRFKNKIGLCYDKRGLKGIVKRNPLYLSKLLDDPAFNRAIDNAEKDSLAEG